MRQLIGYPVPLAVMVASLVLSSGCVPTDRAQRGGGEPAFKLFETVGGEGAETLRVNPGSQEQALDYYARMRTALVDFPRQTLTESVIGDMLDYFGFPALLAENLEALQPAVLMDFAQLREAVSNREPFQQAYGDRPIQPGEILSVRFFAPKIVNVRDPQVNGVPRLGFGWRKVLRFVARADSRARAAGLDAFYLLFNFTSDRPQFPEDTHAGQIQALVVPSYPTGGRHNDIYFLVYQGLGSADPGRVGLFLVATFDLAGIVADDRYFVPTSCGQCHGTERENQPGGKINYLDTDHWIDRTGDDFTLVNPADVLVDGAALGYDTIRRLNREIERQNAAVSPQPQDPKFALLAVRKWLELHREDGPDASRHVPPLRRGFAEREGDAIWTASIDPDDALLPLLNRYCFRCHSSVRYHVFQKQAVIAKKVQIRARINSGNMPQDRRIDDSTKRQLLELVGQLP